MLFPRLAVAAAYLVFSGCAHAATTTVDFTANPHAGAPVTYTPTLPSLLWQATSIDFGSIFWTTQSVGSDDTTHIAAGDTVTFKDALSQPILTIGSGNSGATNMTLSWTTGLGTFVENLTSFNVNRVFVPAGNISFLNVDLFGTLTDPSSRIQAASTSVTLTQSGIVLAVGGALSTSSVPSPLSGTGAFAGLALLAFLLAERARAMRG
jgi:hypothetical protein